MAWFEAALDVLLSNLPSIVITALIGIVAAWQVRIAPTYVVPLTARFAPSLSGILVVVVRAILIVAALLLVDRLVGPFAVIVLMAVGAFFWYATVFVETYRLTIADAPTAMLPEVEAPDGQPSATTAAGEPGADESEALDPTPSLADDVLGRVAELSGASTDTPKLPLPELPLPQESSLQLAPVNLTRPGAPASISELPSSRLGRRPELGRQTIQSLR